MKTPYVCLFLPHYPYFNQPRALLDLSYVKLTEEKKKLEMALNKSVATLFKVHWCGGAAPFRDDSKEESKNGMSSISHSETWQACYLRMVVVKAEVLRGWTFRLVAEWKTISH